jgi:hypothetical protein
MMVNEAIIDFELGFAEFEGRDPQLKCLFWDVRIVTEEL